MKKLPVLAIALFASTGDISAEPTHIAGSWQLVEFVNIDEGKKVYPFGKKPKGYFTYTSDGHVMIQIQREQPPEYWKSLETKGDGRGANSPWYVGYFGRYSVEPESGEVTHHVEGGTLLHYIGTDQKRPYRLSGNSLFIGQPGVWERRLVRIE